MENFLTFRSETLPTLSHPTLLPLRQQLPSWAFADGQPESLGGGIACPYCGLGDWIQTGQACTPTAGCGKLYQDSRKTVLPFPLHLQPSILDITGHRVALSYPAALERLAHLLLEHRPAQAQTLIYTSAQLDYFALFALHEVFRLLGVRNISSNAQHGYWSGGLYQEWLNGQAAPFLTYDQAIFGPNRLYLLSGWNGSVTHPPLFEALLRQRPDLYLVEVMVTETAKKIMAALGPERVLLIRPGSDSHLALAVAHELMQHYPQALSDPFLNYFSDRASFEAYARLAGQESFSPENVSRRIAPEEAYEDRLLQGIRRLAARLASPESVPIHLPSVGLSQTRGLVPHALWANLLACLGKYGLKQEGEPAGGVVHLPGQSNEESVLQFLSPWHFPGRIPMTAEGAEDAARRVDLPPDVYDKILQSNPRSALDFSDPQSRKELFVFFGTRFERMMMNSTRWQRKLLDPRVKFVVVDPFPDAFSLKYAALIIPTSPPTASLRLSQSGEWRLNLSWPRHQAPKQMRSDVTLIYDCMTMLIQLLQKDVSLGLRHPDLSRLLQSGYLQRRFAPAALGGLLNRQEGEVNRAQLWQRIQNYWTGQTGQRPLYCRPEDAEGNPLSWREILRTGSLIHGGVGSRRLLLNYARPHDLPFANALREPQKFKFFLPQASDLSLISGIILNTGRSHLSEQEADLAWTEVAFNACKTSPSAHRPQETLAFISLSLAERLNIKPYDRIWVTHRETRESQVMKVIPSKRLKGELLYLTIHPSWEDEQKQQSLNQLTSQIQRCPYTGQASLKLTRVTIEKLESEL